MLAHAFGDVKRMLRSAVDKSCKCGVAEDYILISISMHM